MAACEEGERGSIKRFYDGMSIRFEVATANVQMNAVLIEADPATGQALSIERRRYRIENSELMRLVAKNFHSQDAQFDL